MTQRRALVAAVAALFLTVPAGATPANAEDVVGRYRW
jgi:hypothetical protein